MKLQILVLENKLEKLETQSAVFQQQMLDVNHLMEQTNEILRRLQIDNSVRHCEKHPTMHANDVHTRVPSLTCDLIYNEASPVTLSTTNV